MKLDNISKVVELDSVESVNNYLSKGWALIMKPVKIKSLENERLVYVLGTSNL